MRASANIVSRWAGDGFSEQPHGASCPFAPTWQLAAEPRDARTFERATAAGIEWHPTFRRLIEALPGHIRSSLTSEQLEALSFASRPQASPHLVNVRVSIPLLWRRYYFACFIGRERRSLSRLVREGQVGAFPTSTAMLVLLSLLVGAATMGLLALLYLAKSVLGIDLFDDPSILHGLFF